MRHFFKCPNCDFQIDVNAWDDVIDTACEADEYVEKCVYTCPRCKTDTFAINRYKLTYKKTTF